MSRLRPSGNAGPSPAAIAGSALYGRMIAFDYGDAERGDIMREVWDPTPWMIEAYTGSFPEGRERDMIEWCHDAFGQESSPIHGHAGRWHRGGATAFGWTWFGFADEADMHAFMAHWPAPQGVEHPR